MLLLLTHRTRSPLWAMEVVQPGSLQVFPEEQKELRSGGGAGALRERQGVTIKSVLRKDKVEAVHGLHQRWAKAGQLPAQVEWKREQVMNAGESPLRRYH